MSAADYVKMANQETLVFVQLEEKEALQNIDEILQVEGVNVFFVGPSDLSQSMGYPGRSDVPEVKYAMDKAFTSMWQRGRLQGLQGTLEQLLITVHYRYMQTCPSG